MTLEHGRGMVAVLGNGPVGQTTALLLAHWGIPTVLLDARAERDPIGSKAICQQRDVLEVWDIVGAGRQIADEGVTWNCSRTFYHDRELSARTFIDRGVSSFPPFVNISQTRTEQLLDEQIARNPLIDVRWGHRVEAVRQDSTGTFVDCVTADGPTTVEADYCVVALGSQARTIREQLGVSFDGRSFDDKFLICDIQADIPGWANERRFYFDPPWNPGRQVLIHSCPDSTYRIDWQVPGDYDLADEEASGALEGRIRQIIGEVPYRIVWKSVYRFHSRVASRMRVGRVLLAGDAAHIVSPFGARGLNSGVADAENAAWKLAFVLRGWAPESLLETYDQERRAAAQENLEVTAATMDFLVPQTDEQAQARYRILQAAATGDASASDRADSGRLSEPFWYVDSPLVTADPGRPFAGRPDPGHSPAPAPGVLVPDLPVQVGERRTRLRVLAREGVLLLAAAGTDLSALRAAFADDTPRVDVVAMADVDPSGRLSSALEARPGEVWVIRPDAYIAAVLDGSDVDGLHLALRRSLGAGAVAPVN